MEQDYQRSLPVAECLRDDVLLAYEMNDQALPPQHGYPLRLVVPGWYGMAHVKWLTGISVVAGRFDGFQMRAYRLRQQPDEEGTPLTRIEPRALLVPPGFPDFMSRRRVLRPGRTVIEGRAWSGWAPVTAVEVSSRRRQLGSRGAGAGCRTVELGPVDLAVGGHPRAASALRPGVRRQRPQPARGAAMEPGRVRQQPCPARHRRSPRLISVTATTCVCSCSGDSASRSAVVRSTHPGGG